MGFLNEEVKTCLMTPMSPLNSPNFFCFTSIVYGVTIILNVILFFFQIGERTWLLRPEPRTFLVEIYETLIGGLTSST